MKCTIGRSYYNATQPTTNHDVATFKVRIIIH